MPIRATEEADFGVFTTITNDIIATTAIHFGYEPLGQDDLRDLWAAQRDRFPWLTLTDEVHTILGYAKGGSSAGTTSDSGSACCSFRYTRT